MKLFEIDASHPKCLLECIIQHGESLRCVVLANYGVYLMTMVPPLSLSKRGDAVENKCIAQKIDC